MLLSDFYNSYIQTADKVGIAGNKNWHATFLLAILIFVIYAAYKYLILIRTKSKLCFNILIIPIIAIVGALSAYSIYLVYLCDSRAAWGALLVCLLIYAGLNIRSICSVLLNRKIIVSTYLCLILLFGVLFYIAKQHQISLKQELDKYIATHVFEKSGEKITDDVRPQLWLGAINLISTYPVLGVGIDRFENVFASFRTIKYFLRPNAAVRSDHPHNCLLYIAASYGIFGLLFWCVLWIYPMVCCLFKYKHLSAFLKVSLFGYILLFIHSLLDLIFFKWPTILIGGILLGFLWSAIWTLPEGNQTTDTTNSKKLNKPIRFLYMLAAIAVLIVTSKMVFDETMASHYFRLGDTYQFYNNRTAALYFYDKGINYQRDPKYLYKAGIGALFDLNNPELALKYFSYYDTIPLTNYAHKNGFTAMCLCKIGKFNLALHYLIKEVVDYPISTVAWYQLYAVQTQLGMRDAAKLSYEKMMETLKYKDLPPTALNLVLSDPEYDSHPKKIPKAALEKYRPQTRDLRLQTED